MRGHFQRAVRNRADRLPQRKVSLCVRGALLGAMVPMFAVGIASAATITVDSLADGTPATDGACTLREAIANANADIDVSGGDCVAGSGEDIIVFSTTGTVTLGSGLPALTDSERTTIDGDIGANRNIDITVSGNNAVGVFRIENGATSTLTWLSIIDGDAVEGGGIINYGNLTLTHSTISGNIADPYGGGIFNSSGANLQVDDCIISDNIADSGGGGLYNSGTAVVANTTMIGNYAGSYGGAIAAFTCTLTVSHSTISGNASGLDGGGIYNACNFQIEHSTIVDNTASRNGGGLHNDGDPAVVMNSTFSGNHAGGVGGAINASEETLTLIHATIAANSADSQGGGLYVNSSVTLNQSIIDGNTAANCAGNGTLINDGGSNLLWPVTDGSCVGFFGDPMLAALQDNGGPTFTMLPGVGSAAVDAVACNPTVADDQRGVARPHGVLCDIGAVEVSLIDVDRIFANGFE